MNHLNDENIDEIMFQLLEGEIKGAERIRILDAINADKKYSALWLIWQQTVLNVNDDLLVMDTNKLKKKEKVPFVLWPKYAAVAFIVLIVGVLVWNINAPTIPAELTHTDYKGKPETGVIKMPEKPITNTLERDTFVPLKEKIKTMVQNSEHLPKYKFSNSKLEIKNILTPNYVSETEKFVENEIEPKSEILTPTKQEAKKETLPIVAQNTIADNIIVTYETESVKTQKTNFIQDKITEKTNLLARIFSKPKLHIVNDSNTRTNKKFIIQNKEFKIIAGF